MSDWINARWTQARQIVELTDVRQARALPATLSPQQHFVALIDAGRLEEAAFFVGVALPRLDGIIWAHDAMRAMPRTLEPEEAAMRAAVSGWIDAPEDARRRAIGDLVDAATDDSPELLLAHAVFLSGGSIAPPDLPAVNPASDLSGRLAAAAVVSAAHREADPETWLAKSLRTADAMARARKP